MTKIIMELNECILNVTYDIQQDYLTEQEKILMQTQLQMLLIAKANLELVNQTAGHIFRSAIEK
jgi:hypothetical protein